MSVDLKLLALIVGASFLVFVTLFVHGLEEQRRFRELRRVLDAADAKVLDAIKDLVAKVQGVHDAIGRVNSGVPGASATTPSPPHESEAALVQALKGVPTAASIEKLALAVNEVRSSVDKRAMDIGERMKATSDIIVSSSVKAAEAVTARVDAVGRKVDKAGEDLAGLADVPRALAFITNHATDVKNAIIALEAISRDVQKRTNTVPGAIADVSGAVKSLAASTEDLLVRVAWYWDWTPQNRVTTGAAGPPSSTRVHASAAGGPAPPLALSGIPWGEEAGSAAIVGENVRRETVQLGQAEGRWHGAERASVDVRCVTLKGDQAFRRQQLEEIADRIGFRAELERVLGPLPQLDRMKLDMVYEFPPAAMDGPLSVRSGEASDKEILQKLPKLPSGYTVQVTFDASLRTLKIRIQPGVGERGA